MYYVFTMNLIIKPQTTLTYSKKVAIVNLSSSDCKIVHGRTVWQHSVSYTLTLTSNMAFVTKKDATLSKTASSGLSL